MGANLSSTFRPSMSSKGRQPKAVSSNNYHSNITGAGSSIIELMKPERLNTKKTMKKKIAKVRDQFTLEELLMASPSRSNSYKRVYPSSSRVAQTASSSFSMEKSVHLDHKGGRTALSCKARDMSFSLEKRVRGDHEEERRPKVSSIISRSESGNSEKKVRFRLPEEADIVIFYSPARQ